MEVYNMKKFSMLIVTMLLILGIAAQVFAVDTTGNNFTMIDPGGGLTGGTNDVHFIWDGTVKTSVAASGQVSNAFITSTCPFSGVTWNAHDVAVYGPGTYTVYADCASGSPGCGTGTPITFTVATGELGVHMLFNWLVSSNIDVVDVWTPNAVFGPSPLAAGGTGICGTNPANKVWDWMSSDWNGDGFNGYPMVDGPFTGFNANFNVMGIVGTATKIGIFLSHGDWYLDTNGNGSWDGTPTDRWNLNFGFGVNGAIPVVTSGTGTGPAKIGIYKNGTWFVDQDDNGAWDGTPTDALYSFGNGVANSVPVTGDWTGTGTARIGIYANGTWFLDLDGNNAWDGTPTDAQYSFGSGVANAIPVTGDWTGTGTTNIGIYADGTWFLDLDGNGVWDGTPTDAQYSFGNGIANAVPVTGDWTGTGTTNIGIYADGTWYVDLDGNGAWDGTPTDAQYFFGNGVAGALPVTGKW
jgi:hypothetical protein